MILSISIVVRSFDYHSGVQAMTVYIDRTNSEEVEFLEEEVKKWTSRKKKKKKKKKKKEVAFPV